MTLAAALGDRATRAAGPSVVALRAVSKWFGATCAVNDVDIDLLAGEVHGLVGENGAGKSTLMRILAGLHPDYAGTISVDGVITPMTSPAQARAHGVVLVHQELSLLPELSVAENILLGHEPRSRIPGFLSPRATVAIARRHLDDCRVALDPTTKVNRLSIAARQQVEIVKGVAAGPRVLILDEPSSSLTVRETRELFGIIKHLAANGTAIVYIFHKIDEIFAATQQVTVLRDGAKVKTAPTGAWTEASLTRSMVGRDLSTLFPHSAVASGAVRLAVKDLARRGAFAPVSFAIRAGEIVGMYGMIGAGRTDVAEAIFGLTPADTGCIEVDGEPVHIRSPGQALAVGIGMTPEDRRIRGLVPAMTVRENISLGSLARFSVAGVIRRAAERGAAATLIKGLQVRAASPEQEVGSLSGGNQQKVVIGRSLMPEPRVLILDEPTRGIDIVAKAEVHAAIDRLARQGLAVLLISSELPEILGMSDRILVMRAGALVADVPRAAATEERLVALAAGAADDN